jgi:hypothetical protein
VLDDIESSGPDLLAAHVRADSIPAMMLAALDLGRTLYGPPESAELAVEGMSSITSSIDPRGGRFRATVYVRCVNYAEIDLPTGFPVPGEVPDAFPGERPRELPRPGAEET